MQKTTSAADRADLDKHEALKKRAARQAAKRELAPETHAMVECTVLPMGDSKVSMGTHIAGLGEAHYEEGETFTVAFPIALALYERGYVNFDGGREALALVKDQRRTAQEAALAHQQAVQAAYDKLIGGAA